MGAHPFPGAIPQSPGSTPAPGHENLALIYQEVLTAITRLRSNRQAATDAGVFRNQMKAAITATESEATSKGYPAEEIRLATFAVVAFLDESILNSNNPVFANWPRMPLQEELFGGHTARSSFSVLTAFLPVAIPPTSPIPWRSLPSVSCWGTATVTASAAKRASARCWRR